MSDNSKMNMMLATMVVGMIGPRLQRDFGIHIMPDDVIELLGLTPVAWHTVSAGLNKAWATFQVYFPPPVHAGAPEVAPVSPPKDSS